VALSPEQIAEHGSIKNALDWNLQPFNVNEECFAHDSRWDWWQIGGRYTGKFQPDYNPETDPANIETCHVCGGTGRRADMVVPSGCNGCHGNGKRVKWPSDWVDRGNITTRAKIAHLGNALSACAFLRNRKWQEAEKQERQCKALFWARFIRELAPDTILVSVDYHL